MDVKVAPLTTAEYPSKAARPFNSRMSKEKLKAAGFDMLPEWKDALTRYLQKIDF
jgi:dTDP-4-dehydrorhamnose reductase